MQKTYATIVTLEKSGTSPCGVIAVARKYIGTGHR